MIIGYAAGTFDMFHIGHLNLLKAAKGLCDYLIVGISTDELVKQYKHHEPIIPFQERAEIVYSCKYVNAVIPQYEIENKIEMCKKLNATILFVGDDHYNSNIWNTMETKAKQENIKIIYLPYTNSISSTKLREKIHG